MGQGTFLREIAGQTSGRLRCPHCHRDATLIPNLTFSFARMVFGSEEFFAVLLSSLQQLPRWCRPSTQKSSSSLMSMHLLPPMATSMPDSMALDTPPSLAPLHFIIPTIMAPTAGGGFLSS